MTFLPLFILLWVWGLILFGFLVSGPYCHKTNTFFIISNLLGIAATLVLVFCPI